MLDRFFLNENARALEDDGFSASHSIAAPIDDPNLISQKFDSISYSKGAAILRMLQTWLDLTYSSTNSSSYFVEQLQNYIEKYQYGNTESSDLWATLSGNHTFSITALMEGWILQKGYPLVREDVHFR